MSSAPGSHDDGAPRAPDDDAGQFGDSLFDDVKQVFVESGWGFSSIEGMPALLSELSGPLGTWPLCVQVVEEADLVIFYSICPVKVPEERRFAVAEFLTRANYGSSLGSFEMDLDDGEVRCKVIHAVAPDGLDAALVERLIRVNGRVMEIFLPGIKAVAGGQDPLEVIDRLGGAPAGTWPATPP
jgi:hypothetical protein